MSSQHTTNPDLPSRAGFGTSPSITLGPEYGVHTCHADVIAPDGRSRYSVTARWERSNCRLYLTYLVQGRWTDGVFRLSDCVVIDEVVYPLDVSDDTEPQVYRDRFFAANDAEKTLISREINDDGMPTHLPGDGPIGSAPTPGLITRNLDEGSTS